MFISGFFLVSISLVWILLVSLPDLFPVMHVDDAVQVMFYLRVFIESIIVLFITLTLVGWNYVREKAVEGASMYVGSGRIINDGKATKTFFRYDSMNKGEDPFVGVVESTEEIAELPAKDRWLVGFIVKDLKRREKLWFVDQVDSIMLCSSTFYLIGIHLRAPKKGGWTLLIDVPNMKRYIEIWNIICSVGLALSCGFTILTIKCALDYMISS